MSLDIEIVLQEPLLLLLLLHVVVFQLRVLHTCLSVTHNENEAGDERPLTDGEGDRFDEIPAKPVDVEDSIVARNELDGVERGHRSHHSPVFEEFSRLNLLLLLLQLVELGLSH